MKPILLILFTGIFLLFTTLAAAQRPDYIGGGVGLTNFDSIDLAFDSPPGTTSDDQDNASKFFIGYDLSPNLVFEASYADLGSYSATQTGNYDIGIDVKAIALDLLATRNVHPRLDFFARLGLAYWTTDLTYNDFVNNTSADSADLGIHLGMGFDLSLGATSAQKFLLRFEWEQFQNVGQDTNAALPSSAIELNGNDLDVLSISVVYRFELAPGN